MDRLFYFLTDLSSFGAYFAVFTVLSSCGIGLPLPEDIPLVASGYLIWNKTFSPFPIFLVSMSGVLIGDLIMFYLGKKLGVRYLFQAREKPLFKVKNVRRARAYFRKYGDKIIFFARFIIGFRIVVFFMAGAMRMKPSRFLFFDSMATLISVPLWLLLGYLLGCNFGDEIAILLYHLENLKQIISLVIVMALLFTVAHLFHRFRRKVDKKILAASDSAAKENVIKKLENA